MIKKLAVNGLTVTADYILQVNGEAVVVSWFDRSANKTKAVGVNLTNRDSSTHLFGEQGSTIDVITDGGYKVVCNEVKKDRDWFYCGLAVSDKVGKSVLITTERAMMNDLYNF